MYEKASALDRIYRRLLLSKFFTLGWGNPATIKRQFDFLRVVADRSSCQRLVDDNYPVNVESDVEKGEVRIVEGHFKSPFDRYLPNVMPKEVKTARFQLIVPSTWPTHRKPVCIHMAGTGDHYFWRRRTFLARPLIKEYGIGSLLLENPFYGCRKPKDQLRSSLRHVNELFVMGGGLILEGLVMLRWCEKQGFGPLGLTGISMGGHMATLTATNWHKPIPLIPCLSWTSATPVFTEGVLSSSVPWPVLATQYMGHTEYEGEIMRKLLKCPKTDAYRIGQEFVWNYPESLDDIKNVRGGAGAQSREPPSSVPKSDCRMQSSPQPGISVTQSESALISPVNREESGTRLPTPSTSLGLTQILNGVSGQATLKEVSNAGESTAGEIWALGKGDLQGTIAGSDGGSKGAIQDAMRDGFLAGDGEMICKHDSTTCTCHRPQTFIRAPLSAPAARETQSMEAAAQSLPGPDSRSGSNHGHAAQRSSTVRCEGRSETGSRVDVDTTNSKRDPKKQTNHKVSTIKQRPAKGLDNYQELKNEALEFMRGVMDVSTFVGNFSTPVDSSLVIVVTALRDGYIPRRGVPKLDDLWPGVEVRYIDCGHISAFLFKQTEFRRAINDAFNKYLAKYDDNDVTKGTQSTAHS